MYKGPIILPKKSKTWGCFSTQTTANVLLRKNLPFTIADIPFDGSQEQQNSMDVAPLSLSSWDGRAFQVPTSGEKTDFLPLCHTQASVLSRNADNPAEMFLLTSPGKC